MIDGLILGFQLFTRIPFKKEVDFSEKNLKTALRFLPLIGGVIGALTGLVVWFFRFQPLLSGGFGLLIYFILSGGIHLDGLSDTVDGFLSNTDKERTLEIMSDSLIGTFGTLSLIIYSILKFGLYGSIELDIIFKIAIASVISRYVTLILIKKGYYVKESGFGKYMNDALESDKYILAIYLILIGLTGFYYYRVLISLLMAIIITLAIEKIAKKKIGGVTGDIYGLNIEVNEIVALLFLMEGVWI